MSLCSEFEDKLRKMCIDYNKPVLHTSIYIDNENNSTLSEDLTDLQGYTTVLPVY